MWVEDEEWNSLMTHLFYVGYIGKFLLLFSPGCFSGFEKNVGWGLVPALKFFVGMLRPI